MNAPDVPPWLIRVVIAVALPTVACFGFYSIDHLDQDNSVLILPTILAYPLALIGLIGLTKTLLSRQSSANQKVTANHSPTAASYLCQILTSCHDYRLQFAANTG